MKDSTRKLLRNGIHIAVLWSFAIGKPLLDKATESVFFFIPRSAAPIDVVLVGIAAFTVGPAILLGIEALLGRLSERASEVFHLSVIAFLFWLLALQMERVIGIRVPNQALIAAVVLGAAATFAYARTRFVPTVLDVLSPAPLLFLGLFLFVSPITPLWEPGAEPGTASVEPSSKPPIVVLIFDEFPSLSLEDRPDHIDASLFPNFARLAAKSTWYENATSVADSTENAVPAILTGQRPKDQGAKLALAHTHPESIFTLLGGTYDIDAVETETQLCPRSVCEREMRDSFFPRVPRLLGALFNLTPAAVLPKRVHRKLFGEGSGVSPLPPDDSNELFRTFDEQISAEEGHLMLIHATNLPHKPWNLVPSTQHYNDPDSDDLLRGTLSLTETPTILNERKRHLLQAGAADTQLGRVIDRLQAEGIWDKAIVVVTADHGISFRPLTYRRHATLRNLDQVSLVPLFVKAPGQHAAKVDPAGAQTIDVVPTIAKLIGLKIPWDVDGQPAGERPPGGAEVNMFDFQGTAVRLPLARVLDMGRAFIRKWGKRLNYGEGWDALIRSGPGSRAIGRPVPAELPKAAGRAEPPKIPDQDSGKVPAVVDGSLSGVESGTPLEIAADGKIVAVTTAINTGDGIRYQAILPPSVYEQPIEQMQVLQVMPDGSLALLG